MTEIIIPRITADIGSPCIYWGDGCCTHTKYERRGTRGCQGVIRMECIPAQPTNDHPEFLEGWRKNGKANIEGAITSTEGKPWVQQPGEDQTKKL